MNNFPKLVERKIRRYLRRRIFSCGEFMNIAENDWRRLIIVKHKHMDRNYVISDTEISDITERFFDKSMLPCGIQSPFQPRRYGHVFTSSYMYITLFQPMLNPEYNDYIEGIYQCKIYYNYLKPSGLVEEKRRLVDDGVVEKWKMVLFGGVLVGIGCLCGWRFFMNRKG